MTRTEHLRKIKADHNLKSAEIATMLTKAVKPYGGELTAIRVRQWLAPGVPEAQPPAFAIALLEKLCAAMDNKSATEGDER